MAKSFGVWLETYDGPNRQLRHLRIKWIAQLRKDYLRAGAYDSPQDVWWSLQRHVGENLQLERLVDIAFRVYTGQLTCTASRFKAVRWEDGLYRGSPDVPLLEDIEFPLDP